MADKTVSAAPMSSAPMKYLPDGSVDWGDMWDGFCALAQEGGPPHRGTMLCHREGEDLFDPNYTSAAHEIIRGIREVSGLDAYVANPGWIAVMCPSASMARWLSEAIRQENVEAQWEGSALLVPVGATFTLKGEIKNVITVVAKTTHYWQTHLPEEVKTALKWEDIFAELKQWRLGWRRHRPVSEVR